MTASNRAYARAPGRTPPFVLVGLVVLLGFLGYSYWSLKQANSQLSKEVEELRLKTRSTDDKNAEIEKNLETAREDLQRAQTSFEETHAKYEERESELTTCRQDMLTKQADLEKSKTLLDQCDENLSVRDRELSDYKAKNTELQKTLDLERQQVKTCDIASCFDPVKQVLQISAQLTGSDKMSKALVEAGLDGTKLMEGIHFPDPNFQQPQQPPNQQPQPGEAQQKPPQQQEEQQQPQQEQKPQEQQQQEQPGGNQEVANGDNKDSAKDKADEQKDGEDAEQTKPETKLDGTGVLPETLEVKSEKNNEKQDDAAENVMKVEQPQPDKGEHVYDDESDKENKDDDDILDDNGEKKKDEEAQDGNTNEKNDAQEKDENLQVGLNSESLNQDYLQQKIEENQGANDANRPETNLAEGKGGEAEEYGIEAN